jgi:hypothetical protein
MAEIGRDTDILEDRLEQEFVELAGKLANGVRNSNSSGIEVVADDERFFKLSIGANGKWSIACANSIHELSQQTLLNVLGHYLMVTDKPYREFDLNVQDLYVHANKITLAQGLMGKMQTALANLG